MKAPAGPGVGVMALALVLWLGSESTSEAQKPIRIGASASKTGTYGALGQNQLRGYQLCVKHTNEKDGVLGRKLELLVEDDRSDAAAAIRIYERLITQDKVDLVFSPYGTPITEPVADVTEKYRMPLVSPIAAASSMYKKGRKFLFMLPSPGEVYLEGLIDLAARRGLKTIALINEDTLFPRTALKGATELARRKGFQLVFAEAYPKGTTDFSAILTRVRAANPDVLGAATFFEDAVAISRQMKELDVSPRMYGVTVGGALPRFYELLGRTAEFVYGASPWEPELVTLRAGGLIPVARQYPGAKEFVESHKKESPGADLSYHTAAGYGSCQILVEAIRRAGSLDAGKIRDVILKMDLNTVYGAFKVDEDGFQIAHKTVTIQWQDGKKVVVWPGEIAPGKPRFPTPPWSQRP
ncbi:MAG: amino acid ABC transporter substrate-binding protein [Candidatus Rokubacteria bacterium]|nr:amino acid ABC transporter substrate-binding protein [Candidatus Rokubacteria bacterium]